MFTRPINNEKYHWTQHVARKMTFYRLSSSRILRVIRAPFRMEEGIAPGTLAAMQLSGTLKRPSEVWVMWQEKLKTQKSKIKNKLKTRDSRLVTDNFLPKQKIIITAWRYPGRSPVRDHIPIPQNILRELQEENLV